MQIIKWASVAIAIILAIACFYPWVTIESKNIIVSGVSAIGTSFGKPGYLHLFFIVLYIPLILINKIWSQRICIFLCALNTGWAIRNFILITSCQGGECPIKHAAIYFVIFASIGMLAGALLTVPSQNITATE